MAQAQNNPMTSGRRLCGAKNRKGGACKLPPMTGKKRCKLHGGASTGPPKGTKNALKTGEHEFKTVFDSLFTGEEAKVWASIDTAKEAQLRAEVQLFTMREYRMMQRIHDLKQHQFTVIEITEEDGEAYDHKDGMVVPVKRHTEKQAATLGQIQAIEDALTRVQNSKAKAIELLIKLDEEKPKGIGDTVQKFLDALSGKVADAWADEPDPDGEEAGP